MELAIATHTSPAAWWDEDDATVATALAVLADQAEQIENETAKARKRRK